TELFIELLRRQQHVLHDDVPVVRHHVAAAVLVRRSDRRLHPSRRRVVLPSRGRLISYAQSGRRFGGVVAPPTSNTTNGGTLREETPGTTLGTEDRSTATRDIDRISVEDGLALLAHQFRHAFDAFQNAAP